MTKVEEEVSIDIKKDKDKISVKIKDDEQQIIPTQSSRRVKDIDFQLNLLTTTTSSIILKKINGFLQSFILSASKQCSITIRFSTLPNIVLYENRQFHGTQYLPLRAQAIKHDATFFSFGVEKWAINNELEIIVDGSIGTVVNGTVRYV